MVDFIVNLLAEIADFFIAFGADNVIDRFTKSAIGSMQYLHETAI